MELFSVRIPPLVNPLSYPAYKAMMEECIGAADGAMAENNLAALKLNLQRMKRVEKQFVLLPALKELLEQYKPAWHWVVLVAPCNSENAQLIPAIAAIAAQVPAIQLSILLSHENPDWMATCLTNHKPATPMLICLDADQGERLFTWGPRPAQLHKKYLAYRAQHPHLTTGMAAEWLLSWYAQDRSQAFQQDLLALARQEFHFTSDEVLWFL